MLAFEAWPENKCTHQPGEGSSSYMFHCARARARSKIKMALDIVATAIRAMIVVYEMYEQMEKNKRIFSGIIKRVRLLEPSLRTIEELPADRVLL